MVYGEYDQTDAVTQQYSKRYYSTLDHISNPVNGLADLVLIQAEPATFDLYRLAHDPSYVELLERVLVSGRYQRGITPNAVRFEKQGVGGSVLASSLALDQQSIVFHLGGGYHHGRADRPGSIDFCNDVAIAIRHLTRRVSPLLYIDLDAHYPDGAQAILGGDADVYSVSLHTSSGAGRHGLGRFTGRGEAEGHFVNIALPPGTGDEAYLEKLETGLRRVCQMVSPRVVFYQGGVDPHRLDPLADLGLSLAGLYRRDAVVLRTIQDLDVPASCVLGGGYHPVASPMAIVNLVAALSERDQVFLDPE